MSVQTQVRPRLRTEGNTKNAGQADSKSSATLDLLLRVRVDVVSVSLDDHDEDVLLAHEEDVPARCRRCRHLLTAERSVSRGTGPVCAKAERGEVA